MIVRTSALVTALVLAVGVSHAFGQACVGVPAPQGAYALTAHLGVTDGAKSYGAGFAGNLNGPLHVQGGYTLTNFDNIGDDMHTVGGGVGTELPGFSFSACPWVGAEYSSWSSDFGDASLDITQTTIPVGFGVGRNLGMVPGVSVYAMPQLMYMRARVKITEDGMSESFSDSTTEFGARLGFTLGNGSLYGGGFVGFTTIDESDPLFGVSVGVVLGR